MPNQVHCCVEDADQELQQRVVACLQERHVPGLRRIDVAADRGTVTLSGHVRSFYEKQLCQSFTRFVPGVVKLVDNVEVVY